MVLKRLRRLLPIGSVELLQKARDALLTCAMRRSISARAQSIADVHRLEPAAVDRDAGFVSRPIVPHSAMKRGILPRMGRTIVLIENRDGL